MTEDYTKYKSWAAEEAALCGSALYRVGGVSGPDVPMWVYAEAHADSEFGADIARILSHPRTPLRKNHMLKLLRQMTSKGEISPAEVAYYKNLTKGDEFPPAMAPWKLELAFVYHFPDGMAISSTSAPKLGMGIGAIIQASAGLAEGVYAQEGGLMELRKSIEDDMIGTIHEGDMLGLDDVNVRDFEGRMMKDFPDFFGVLIRMGVNIDLIPLTQNELPEALVEAFNRAAVRTELSLSARRIKTDLKYANGLFDDKYKRRNRELPYMPAPEQLVGNAEQERIDKEASTMLPGWLPPSDPLAPTNQKFDDVTDTDVVKKKAAREKNS